MLVSKPELAPHGPACEPPGIAPKIRTATSIPGGHDEYQKDGRDHNTTAYSMWVAGGGVKGGLRYGASDEFGIKAVENKVHPHDMHATILHLLGLDHEKLTYRYGGCDYKLTGVGGARVLDAIIA